MFPDVEVDSAMVYPLVAFVVLTTMGWTLLLIVLRAFRGGGWL